MKLLIPVSYFFSSPRSEIWQLDTDTGQKACWMRLPDSNMPVRGKGITHLARMDANGWLACDFNRLLHVDNNGELIKCYFDEQNNDFHHFCLDDERVYLANTGRDCIDVIDHNFERVARHDGISQTEWQSRQAGDYDCQDDYYDSDTSLPFYQRRVPDRWHFNHVVKLPRDWGSRLLATSFTQKSLVDVHTMDRVSNTLEHQPHDGALWQGKLWLSTVSGQLHCAQSAYPLNFLPVFDLFSQAPYKGWCRGLLFSGNKLFIGITAIHKHNDRTKWLDVGLEQTRSGIYQVCPSTWQVEGFFDFTCKDGTRIFSLTAEREAVSGC